MEIAAGPIFTEALIVVGLLVTTLFVIVEILVVSALKS